MTVAVFPDVEAAVMSVLTTALQPAPHIGTKIPNPVPASWVRVFRSGTQEETLVSEGALITVEAWALLEADAIALLNRCRAALRPLQGSLFGVVRYGGPTNLPHPDYPDHARYTASFIVRARLTHI